MDFTVSKIGHSTSRGTRLSSPARCRKSVAIWGSRSSSAIEIIRPPHFHVRYAGDSAIIAIETMQILEGRLPARVYRLIAEWGMHHRALLRENWRRAMAREPLLSIPPLEV